MQRIVITKIEKHKEAYTAYIVLDENRRFEELQVFEPEERSILDHIYVGYVEKVVCSVHAAFVRIAGGQKCYLPLDDLKSPVYVRKQSDRKQLSEGDTLLVQVTRDAVKTKDAVVSTKLTIHGLYCFLTTENTCLAVSKKLDPKRADQLLSLASELCEDHEKRGYGLVFRTNAGNQTAEVLAEDITETIRRFEQLILTGIHRKQTELLYRNFPGYLTRLKGQSLQMIDNIYTDQADLYEEITAALPQLAASGILKFYQDNTVSLATLYGIRSGVEQLLSTKVWLASGANILIESLETLTFIDVNSSKNISRRADALFQVNLEAAKEIARQLKLRNLSGMILIDFINMKSKEQKEKLISCLKLELKKDYVPVKFVDITKLGLVELTRKKVYKSLREVIGTGQEKL